MRFYSTKNSLIMVLFLAGAIALIPFLPVYSAGIVPCGGPGQPDCNICWFFVLMRQTLDFLLFEAATALAGFALAVAGVLFLFSGYNPGRYETAKAIVTNVFKGYLAMMAGWLFVNTFFMVIGVTEWSGLKDGWWKVKVTCGMPEEGKFTCGDGLVTAGEKCDPKETVADCQARTGNTMAGCEDIFSRCIEGTCELKPKLSCGDGKVTGDEKCDPKETVANCQTRTGNTAAGCEDILARCIVDTCELKDEVVANQCNEEKDKIGLGCYLDVNNNGKVDDSECKKGKYVCMPDTKKLKCVNVFGDVEYTKDKYQTDLYKPKNDYTGKSDFYITDYCCENLMDEYADGKIGDKPFTIVRATPADVHLTGGKTLMQDWAGEISLDNNTMGGLRGGFNCDEICKKNGKLCVGVGLTDPSKNACVYEVHDLQGIVGNAAQCNNAGKPVISMQISGNQAHNNCKAYFGFLYYSHDNERWSTAYDKYEYFCVLHDPRSYHGNMTGGAVIPPAFVQEVPDNSCGVCKPKAAAGETCAGSNYKQDPSDSCAFHGNDLGETACYCY
jgi:hypothetical protein